MIPQQDSGVGITPRSLHRFWTWALGFQTAVSAVIEHKAEWKENGSPPAWHSLGTPAELLQSWAALQRECRHRPIGPGNMKPGEMGEPGGSAPRESRTRSGAGSGKAPRGLQITPLGPLQLEEGGISGRAVDTEPEL